MLKVFSLAHRGTNPREFIDREPCGRETVFLSFASARISVPSGNRRTLGESAPIIIAQGLRSTTTAIGKSFGQGLASGWSVPMICLSAHAAAQARNTMRDSALRKLPPATPNGSFAQPRAAFTYQGI